MLKNGEGRCAISDALLVVLVAHDEHQLHPDRQQLRLPARQLVRRDHDELAGEAGLVELGGELGQVDLASEQRSALVKLRRGRLRLGRARPPRAVNKADGPLAAPFFHQKHDGAVHAKTEAVLPTPILVKQHDIPRCDRQMKAKRACRHRRSNRSSFRSVRGYTSYRTIWPKGTRDFSIRPIEGKKEIKASTSNFIDMRLLHH